MEELAILGRVALGALLGFIIGAERERRGSRAGDRTFALVALGAAGFTAVGVENFPATAEKLIAGVVTGVGFLGAGLIMKGNDGNVLGLTTAASIWATAAAGIYAGAGEPILAVGLAVIVLLILESPYVPILRKLHTDNQRRAAERPDEIATET
jgi:putative Mg2+ transporter-C (MgtC) family protein